MNRMTISVPISYPPELPIVEKKELIITALQKSQVIIVAGDTGSGKTTQLPKICLEIGRGHAGRIGHTQPRRIAARAVAERIAQELNSPLGDLVGYKTRFREQLSLHTTIKLMTDGILLAEMQHDRLLKQYDTIIVDEAHERSVNIDFILGCLKKILPKRPDLKVIVTSATLELQRFSDYFDGAPVIAVEGRNYPIEMVYKAQEDSNEIEAENKEHTFAITIIRDLIKERAGDVLVFLPTERVIHDFEKLLKKEELFAEIVMLYSRLSVKDQHKVFKRTNQLRVVLATNVAETSLTVPGIRYVVDAGTARISRYSQRMKVQRLPIERISQASAMQRAGRCGRVGPGKCIRLYSRVDFESRDLYTLPEILRTNLAQIILRMVALGLGRIEDFPFIEPPNPRYINDGYQLLMELGALDAQRNITTLGQKMARLGIDPRLSRLLIAGSEKGSLAEMMIIASFLEAQDPRMRPRENPGKADQIHQEHGDKRSDFVAIINLWNWLNGQKIGVSRNKFRQFCEKHFISAMRYEEWCEIHAQLSREVEQNDLRINQQPADYASLHRALLTGFFTQIACKQEKGDYLATRGNKIKIFPGSFVYKAKPQWIVAGTLLETEQLYAHLVATIEPEWVIEAAGTFVKYHYADPHWEKKSQRVTAFRRTTLLGLILEEKKSVNYEKIDPILAREIFIKGAMVLGEWEQPLEFFIKNQALIENTKELEEQSRRRDIIIDDESLYAFYDNVIPHGIVEIKELTKWYRYASETEKKKLLLTGETIIHGMIEDITKEKFPGDLLHEGRRWSLSYHFSPGEKEDGITMAVPLEGIKQVPYYYCEWLVPGFLPEKVEALLRGLPKMLRKQIMPLQDVSERFVKEVPASNTPLLDALTSFLFTGFHCRVTASQWREQELPLHLKMYFKVYDKAGKIFAQGRDYHLLVAQCSGLAKSIQEEISEQAFSKHTGMTTWACDELAKKMTASKDSTVCFYPALKKSEKTVEVVYLDDEQEAIRTHEQGVLQLLLNALTQEIQYCKKSFAQLKTIQLQFSVLGKAELLLDDLFSASAKTCFLESEGGIIILPRSKVAFEALLTESKKHFIAIAQKKTAQLAEIMQLYTEVRKVLSNKTPHFNKAFKEVVEDIEKQISALVYPGFVHATPTEYWLRLPSYLRGIVIRLDKLSVNPACEKLSFPEFQKVLAKYTVLVDTIYPPRKKTATQQKALENYRWMLEEYRLSLFAQPMKTLYKVSTKRMEEAWQNIAKI